MNTSSRRWQKAFYAAGNIGNGVYSGFNNAILSLYLTAFTSNPFLVVALLEGKGGTQRLAGRGEDAQRFVPPQLEDDPAMVVDDRTRAGREPLRELCAGFVATFGRVGGVAPHIRDQDDQHRPDFAVLSGPVTLSSGREGQLPPPEPRIDRCTDRQREGDRAPSNNGHSRGFERKQPVETG